MQMVTVHVALWRLHKFALVYEICLIFGAATILERHFSAIFTSFLDIRSSEDVGIDAVPEIRDAPKRARAKPS